MRIPIAIRRERFGGGSVLHEADPDLPGLLIRGRGMPGYPPGPKRLETTPRGRGHRLMAAASAGWRGARQLGLEGRTRDVQFPQGVLPADQPSRRRSGRKVLVVDDQPEALVSTVELFRMMGFDVLDASSGDDAVEVLGQVPDIEVLFTDVFMPRMDGVRLAREARRLIPGINVILVSGFPASAMDLHTGEPGEFHFLMKPFLMSEVAIVLRR